MRDHLMLARTRPRWKRATEGDVAEAMERLVSWPDPQTGPVRHMFPLETLRTSGHEVLRVARRGDAWAGVVVVPSRVVVPCGDPDVLAAAGPPVRRWRLVIGDARAADAFLDRSRNDPAVIIHRQRFLVVDPARVPGEDVLPDPGLRVARLEDIEGLADLAVQLHIDDGYGPDPGAAGWRSYQARFRESVPFGNVYCVGPRGRPIAKVERSVSSPHYGVQLAGICVQPDQRGRGVGGAATAAAVRAALRVSEPVALHVRSDNTPALRAYARAGFVDREDWRLAVRT